MIDKEIIAALAAYDKRMFCVGIVSSYNIIRRRKFDDKTQVIKFDYICDPDKALSGTSSAIIVDNKVYVPGNWWCECPFTDEEVKQCYWIEAVKGDEMIFLDEEKNLYNLKMISPDVTEEELLALCKAGELWI